MFSGQDVVAFKEREDFEEKLMEFIETNFKAAADDECLVGDDGECLAEDEVEVRASIFVDFWYTLEQRLFVLLLMKYSIVEGLRSLKKGNT